MTLIVSAIGQGLIWGLLGIGLFITFRILNFPDMTVEGTFPFGAAVCVSAITHGLGPAEATLLAFFAGLLGGTNLATFLCTFITSIFAVILYNKIMKLSSIPAFSSLLASTFIAIVGVLLSHIGILDTPRMLIVGSIMPLLPGVSFIKGIRDLISGDLISGVARAFDAGMTAIAIACGVGLILDLWVRLGGVF